RYAHSTFSSSTESYVLLFFTDPATTRIYTLSLHDALPISRRLVDGEGDGAVWADAHVTAGRALEVRRKSAAVQQQNHLLGAGERDRKSTRLNSSHVAISYAVFCLKKKKRSLMFSRVRHESS